MKLHNINEMVGLFNLGCNKHVRTGTWQNRGKTIIVIMEYVGTGREEKRKAEEEKCKHTERQRGKIGGSLQYTEDMNLTSR